MSKETPLLTTPSSQPLITVYCTILSLIFLTKGSSSLSYLNQMPIFHGFTQLHYAAPHFLLYSLIEVRHYHTSKTAQMSAEA